MNEASLHQENCYLTLTYNNENLPQNGSLCHRDFQLFLKRLRKSIHPRGVRYYMCGEYGDELSRPHYHALLFGYDFQDKRFHKRIKGNPSYTSSRLSELWGKGFCTIGAVTIESASYVARYILKKQKGKDARAHYMHTDTDTGEIIDRVPEYTRMSLKRSKDAQRQKQEGESGVVPGGIGGRWIEAYLGDVYPDDFVVVGGRKFKVPRYYDGVLRRRDEDSYNAVKERRRERALENSDNSRERLAVREVCAERRVENLKRPYEGGNEEWN